MKRNYLYMLMGCLLANLAACTDDAPDMKTDTDTGRRIYLSACVGDIDEKSRTPYLSDGQTPTMSNPLNVSVWASTDTDFKFPHKTDQEGKVYDGSIGNEVAIHTTARFQSGEPQLLGEAIYPKPDEDGTIDVYFVGLYPQSQTDSEWRGTNDNRKAFYEFSGKEDVMFAPRITGTYGLDYEEHPELIPEFHFYHLLTWLQVQMVADKDVNNQAEQEKISAAWGKVKSLTLTDVQNRVTVDLTTAATEIDDKSDVTALTEFDGSGDMNFYLDGTDTSLNYSDQSEDGYVIPTQVTDVAYVMCAPVEGVFQHKVDEVDVLKPEYVIHVKTENRELSIPIDLKVANGDNEDSYFKGSTMGKKFKILLNFKNGNVITVATDIMVSSDFDWYTHGTGITDLNEGNLNN